jgi:prepilin-type N-terminal cleavage/methylation domain-containing protein
MIRKFFDHLIKKSNHKNRRGFTLIEIMIAISILAILATIGMTTYSQAQLRGRDAKRKQDLRAISTALELYYQRNKRFPCSTTWQSSSYTGGAWLRDETVSAVPACDGSKPIEPQYINSLPVDPISNTSATPYAENNLGYGYHSAAWCSAVAGQSYILVAQLENPNDSEAHSRKQYKSCDGAVYATPPWGPNSFIISAY